MDTTNRFQDENLVLSDFYKEVWVVCASCSKKALATVNFETKKARLFCTNCGYNKEVSTLIYRYASAELPANMYFEAKLWLIAPFKNDVFLAYNDKHLAYLERYIGATLREHKDRTGFTLLEKLPKFYHDSRNRDGLLKLIGKLRSKC